MTIPIRLITAAVVCLVLSPALAQAQAPMQQQDQPMNYVVVTTMHVPFGPERQQFMEYMDSIYIPLVRMDPSILSFRMLTHGWGANSSDVVLVADYANWAAIEAECAACTQWYESRRPAEGTPERAAWDAREAVFTRANAGHADEIYAENPTRRKP